MVDYQEIIEKIKSVLGTNTDIKTLELTEDGQAILTDTGFSLDILTALKDKFGFKMLLDITSVDYPESFEVLYHVMSINNADMVRVKIKLAKECPQAPSAAGIWKSADVLEREVFDLMGITFTGHPCLKRILCRDDFEFNPLRKDFKLSKPSRILNYKIGSAKTYAGEYGTFGNPGILIEYGTAASKYAWSLSCSIDYRWRIYCKP